MTNRRVKEVKSLQFGIKVGREMRNSVDAEKHGYDIRLTPPGILMRKEGELDRVIPWGNTANEIVLYPEEEDAVEELHTTSSGGSAPGTGSGVHAAPEPVTTPPDLAPAAPEKPVKPRAKKKSQ